MADLTSQLIDGLGIGFPDHEPGTRPIHSKGLGAEGIFRGTAEASYYCKAPQFRARTQVTVRFSNGNGSMDPDGRRQVRGMAVKFHIADELGWDVEKITRSKVETDLVCMSVPTFMARTPEALLEFEQSLLPRRVRRPGPVKQLKTLLRMQLPPDQEPGVKKSGDEGVLAFSNRYAPAQPFVLANSMLRPSVSYARTVYHAVHAFDIEGSDGTHRWGRFFFEPAAGVRSRPDDEDPRAIPPDYLQEELVDRTREGVVRFNLRMQLADPFDDPSDPTRIWPQNRRRILMGTLALTCFHWDASADIEKMSFNPGRLLPGMGLSPDPVLHARIAAYEESQRRRGAEVCPFQVPAPPPA